MTKKERALLCIEALKKEYPDALCSLDYSDPLHLLIATRLAAQCTDERVNMIAPALFEKYPDAKAFAAADVEDVGKMIHSCGFYRTKSKDIVELSRMILDEFDGEVPDTLEKLTSLPGIGRKTANLIMGDVYGKPAIIVDTHCIRLCRRIGLTTNTSPDKIEEDLRKILPPDESNNFCHRLVLHGRAVCTARLAKCEECCLSEYCKSAFKATEKMPSKQK